MDNHKPSGCPAQRPIDTTSNQTNGKAVPAGRYRARLVESGFRKSSRGTPGWRAKFEITGGPHAGRRLIADFWLSERAKPVSKDRLARMDLYNIDDLRTLTPGQDYLIDVTQRIGDNGDTYVDVNNVQVCRPDTTAPNIRREPDTERQRADERRASLPYEEEEVYYTEPQPPDGDDDDDSPFRADGSVDYSKFDFS